MTDPKPVKAFIDSEIGELEAVILHTPGSEVESMTPSEAQRALYSDILNLSVANYEYDQFAAVLNKLTKTFQVRDLIEDILEDEKCKQKLTEQICTAEKNLKIRDYLLELDNKELARQLIEGTPVTYDSLTNFLSKERFAMRPLHNFFFTRDSSMTLHDNILIGKMANSVRERESMLMEAIFNNSKHLQATTINPDSFYNIGPETTIEGGDVLVARRDITIIGSGARTSTQGIDFVINQMKQRKERHYIVVQQLPRKPESFIHLDMVFTMLDVNQCMVYEPVILHPGNYLTILIEIDNGQVKRIEKKSGLMKCLKELGLDLKPVLCGGKTDSWKSEREQWHSGANFFAVAPGKVIGYERNIYTLEAMNNEGYEIIPAIDVLNNSVNINNYNKYAITIEGSELARGGGGARCMTMPFRRKPLSE
jgi:arginine deiminase